mmetsp:Transcript_28757/g.72800  ORF Transcript_28757/g.72800 Transcript_28757/m.72800 type:complete len:163 (-) Transcript_28757:761-1249(-)
MPAVGVEGQSQNAALLSEYIRDLMAGSLDKDLSQSGHSSALTSAGLRCPGSDEPKLLGEPSEGSEPMRLLPTHTPFHGLFPQRRRDCIDMVLLLDRLRYVEAERDRDEAQEEDFQDLLSCSQGAQPADLQRQAAPLGLNLGLGVAGIAARSFTPLNLGIARC